MKQQTGIVIGIGVTGLVIVAIATTLVLVLPDGNPKPQLQHVVATANQGNMIGVVTPQAAIFHGIPFSQPPTGEFRWRKPRDPLPFPGAYWNATYIRPACIQICHQPAEEYSCPHSDDEDCLFLNVWVPSRLLTKIASDKVIDAEHYVIEDKYKNGDENSLAVMLFFYGGNFLNGGGSATLYDSRYLADQGNVIGVTMNYRVGPLGFLVQGEGEDAAMGNYGIWDQIKSLEWIRDNIKHFGGNPNMVTVYGQSAGAESIGVLMTSPYSRNLFHRAIMESNPFGLPFRDRENAKEFGRRFTEAAGCIGGDMDCMRKTEPAVLKQAYLDTSLEVVGVDQILLIFQPWSPVIDNDFLPEQPVDTFMKGEAMSIPTIIGSTVDEGMLFVAVAFPNAINNAQYRAIMRAVMKKDATPILNNYQPMCRPVVPENDCDNRVVMNDLATDYLFLCPQRAAMFSMGPDTWFYIFNETWSFYELWEIPLCFDRVCHAAELPYVFNVANLTIYDYTDTEDILSERMGYYWTNFAKYGDPNGPADKKPADMGRLGQITDGESVDAKYWPRFGEMGAYNALHMTAEGDHVASNPYNNVCDFWDNLDAYGQHFV